MKKLLTGAILLLNCGAYAQNEAPSKKSNDVTFSAMYIINTAGKTMSGGCAALSVNDFSVLAMIEHGNNNDIYYGAAVKESVYNVGIGHKIALSGHFCTRAFIGGGLYRTTTSNSYYYYGTTNNDDFKANITAGLLGEGRYISFLSAIESNYKGTSLLLGIGINTGILK